MDGVWLLARNCIFHRAIIVKSVIWFPLALMSLFNGFFVFEIMKWLQRLYTDARSLKLIAEFKRECIEPQKKTSTKRNPRESRKTGKIA